MSITMNNTEYVDLKTAAKEYGCQVDRILSFIYRGSLHPVVDLTEVKKLRQSDLKKRISNKSNVESVLERSIG